MRIPFGCDDKETLVAYVYGELPPGEREAVERHLSLCAACAAEIGGIGEVRQSLAGWMPPEPALGFTLVPQAALAAPPALRSAWTAAPAWAQLAAAVLALAAGAAIANIQVRSDASGLTITTGWMTPASAQPAPVLTAAAAPASPPGPVRRPVEAPPAWQPALADLESRLRAEMRTTRATPASASASAVRREVEALIAESEQRQRQEFAMRLAQLGRDVDLQRRADLVRLEQGVGQMQGRTGAEVARQRELLNYIVRTSMQRPQQ